MLHCSLCETVWPFKVIKCPHCLDEDHENMLYFTVTEDETHRIDACKKCKGYIKTVNEKEMVSRENSFITDFKTIYLDIIAAKEGYLKGIQVQHSGRVN